jgi:hypothetical protein
MYTAMRPAVLALVALAGCAQFQPQDLAGRLYLSAGLDAQVRSIPGEFAQGVEDYRGQAPEEVIAALADAGRKGFAPEALREEIVGTLAQKLTASEMKEAVAWLESEVGRRLIGAEESAVGNLSKKNLDAYLALERGKPAAPGRDALLAELIRETNAVEIGASFIEAISLGIAVGMDATQPAEKRIGVAGLRLRLRAAMPPQRLRADLNATLPAMYGYMYRSIGDADLAAYVRFNGSSLGKRYNDAVTAAFVQALTRASVRVGEMIDVPQREKV